MYFFTNGKKPFVAKQKNSGINRWMRLLVCMLCMVQLSLHAEVWTQGITISGKNLPIEKVFDQIKKQAGYAFFVNKEIIRNARPVTINVKNVAIDNVLKMVFDGQPFTYNLDGKNVFVVRFEQPSQTSASIGASVNDPAKKKQLKGRVVGDGGKPVAGATVAMRSGAVLGQTDENGEFELYDVEDNAIIVITSVSHEPYMVSVRGKSQINVELKPRVNSLDETIVVAYNTTTQRNNVGAVTVVKGEQVRDQPVRSVDKALQGLVPGLLVTSGTGQPGGGVSNFVLRGIATGANPLNGSTVRNPLIVIDGMPVTQDNFQMSNSITDAPVINPMAQLNPADIESITVLKDAAAIALYGAKASNGVILITTYKGKVGKTVFNFRHQTDIATKLDGKVELLNQQEYLQLLYETYKNTPRSVNGVPTPWTDTEITAELKGKFPTRAGGSFYPETDWAAETYNNHALTLSNTLSVSGGNDKNKFYINIDYTKQDGTLRKTGYDRKSLRFNYESRPASWIKLGLNTGLSYNIQDYAAVEGSTFPFGIAAFFPPLNPARDEKGNLILNYTNPYPVANPLAAMAWNKNRNTAYRALSSFNAEVSVLKNLKFSSSVGIDFMLLESIERVDPRLYDYLRTKDVGGRQQERFTRNANFITTNLLKFEKTIKDQHSINVLAGQEAQIVSSRYMEAYQAKITNPTFDFINNGAGGTSNAKQTMLSYFSQLNYSFLNRYFVTGSIRKDGASRFGENRRFGTYWSSGAGWILSSEPFMRSTGNWLDYFKVRGSVGAAGNAAAIDKYTRFDILTTQNYQNNQAVYVDAAGNWDIQWEQTFTWDAGIEARFLKNRIAITADIYKRKTSDVIYSINLPGVTGMGAVLDNLGDIQNSGVELSLSVDVMKIKNFSWNIRGNWSTNKNILVKANVPLETISGSTLANEVGRNYNSFFMPVWAGVNVQDGSPMWIDSTGKPNSIYSAAKSKFVGKPQPDAFGAFSSTFSYGNFELSAQFYYQYGFQINNTFTLTGDGFNPLYNQDKRALNYWKKAGDVAPNPKRTLNNTAGINTSTRFLSNGDFIRFQDLTLSYSVPQSVIRKLKLSNLRVYVKGANLAIWNTFSGRDPGDVNVAGAVNFSYPNQRSFSLGANLTF